MRGRRLYPDPDHTTICRFRNALVEAGLNAVTRAEAGNPALGFGGIPTFMNVGEAMAAGTVLRTIDAPGGFSV